MTGIEGIDLSVSIYNNIFIKVWFLKKSSHSFPIVKKFYKMPIYNLLSIKISNN